MKKTDKKQNKEADKNQTTDKKQNKVIEIFKNRATFIIISLAGLIGIIVSFCVINNSIVETSSIYQLKKPDTTATTIKAEFEKKSVVFKINTSGEIKKETIFNSNPVFLLWIGLIVGMFTIASGAFGIYLIRIFDFKKEYELNRSDILLTFTLAIIIIIVIVYIEAGTKGMYDIEAIFRDFKILFREGYETIPVYIPLVTLILTIPIIMTIFLISLISQDIEQKNDENELKEYVVLNKLLMNSLQILAVIIVFSVLTTSSLGQAIKNQIVIDPKYIDPKYFDIFPRHFSYIYGLLFSLFLGVIFIPVYIQLQNRGKVLLEKYENNGDKKSLIDRLKNDNSLKDNIKLALTIISPLITSFLPEIKL